MQLGQAASKTLYFVSRLRSQRPALPRALPVQTLCLVGLILLASCSEFRDKPDPPEADTRSTVDTAEPTDAPTDTQLGAPDTVQPDTASPPVDTTPPPEDTLEVVEDLGKACQDNGECLSELCLPTEKGGVCTQACSESCPAEWYCTEYPSENEDLSTAVCAPSPVACTCAGKTCGDNGCGESCGTCEEGTFCFEAQCAENCTPECSEEGLMACTADLSGSSSCGQFDEDVCLEWSPSTPCPAQHTCQNGECLCIPDCDEKNCGSDGCGEVCGTCDDTETCTNNQCICIPQCEGKNCGADGCGASCGTCDPGYDCEEDQCVCLPDCTGKDCGFDGCGGSCGYCGTNGLCVADLCVCTPTCEGKSCGDDGCAGLCSGTGCVQIYHRSVGEETWAQLDIDPLTQHAPSQPIEAAFYVKTTQRIWVLTATKYHILNPSSWKWVHSSVRDNLLPELSGITLRGGWAIPASFSGSPVDWVAFITAENPPKQHTYGLEPSSSSFQKLNGFNYDLWTNASSPDPSTIIGVWTTLSNQPDYPGNSSITSLSPAILCPQNTDETQMGAYQMVLTSTGSTHIFEAQYCYKFVAELESSSLDYFQIPGAPNPEQIKAVVWAPDQFVVFSTAP